MLTHNMDHRYQPDFVGLHSYSLDGLTWHEGDVLVNTLVGHCVNLCAMSYQTTHSAVGGTCASGTMQCQGCTAPLLPVYTLTATHL